MDISSVSTSSLSHVTPQSGTKVASSKQSVEGTQPNITNQQKMAESVEKLSQRRVEQLTALKIPASCNRISWKCW